MAARKQIPEDLSRLRDQWRKQWENALQSWSRFTRLTEPRWCLTESEEKKEQLSDSFAMIRLVDHAVVISIRQVADLNLQKYGREILAHEIGHHVYAPADLTDNARLIAHVRAGLPTRETWAGVIANLYTDLLINDRLQRSAGLNMAGVYQALRQALGAPTDPLMVMYLRIYEILWSLAPGTLAGTKVSADIKGDAVLGARVIRAYGREWLAGAGRFAALCLTYLLEKPDPVVLVLAGWGDTLDAGAGGDAPDGLTEIDPDEIAGAIHPAEDDALTGLDGQGLEDEADKDQKDGKKSAPRAGGRAVRGGQKSAHRPPQQYRELMKSLGVKLSEQDMLVKYYRERALPYLIKFPGREVPESTDPQPEGLLEWDPGSPIENIDWIETVSRSPYVIPGVTTVERAYGVSPGASPEKIPLDLYLGVDCSGSMLNPALDLSYPVMAGAIIVISALRAGAKVMVCLSGEPGQFSQTDGFRRSEHETLAILTGYLGTGYSYGITRLRETFLKAPKPKRPAHILIVTDGDIFHMLKDVKDGWEIARRARERAGGGGTYALHLDGSTAGYYQKEIGRMIEDGWNVHFVNDQRELVAFARAFSKAKYEKPS